MAGEYLPPVVTRLEGEMGDFIAMIAAAKAALNSLAESEDHVQHAMDLKSAAADVQANRLADLRHALALTAGANHLMETAEDDLGFKTTVVSVEVMRLTNELGDLGGRLAITSGEATVQAGVVGTLGDSFTTAAAKATILAHSEDEVAGSMARKTGEALAQAGILDTVGAATRRSAGGIRVWGMGWMGWLKLIHNAILIFGAQIIADSIGLIAFGIAVADVMGKIFSNIKNLGAAWNSFSGAEKVAAQNLSTFMNTLQNHDLQVVAVFDSFLQTIATHMNNAGGATDQAAFAFMKFSVQVRRGLGAPEWQRLFGANGVIGTDISALLTLIGRFANALVSMAHNFNFLGLWALSGIGMVLKAITWLNNANPTLARFAFLTLAAYHAITFLTRSALAAWFMRLATATRAAWVASAGWSATLGGSRVLSFLQLLTGAGAGAIAVVGGLALGFTALAAGILLGYEVSKNYVSQNQKMIDSLTQADRATGTNIAGYQKLAGQLGQTQKSLIALHAGQVLVGQAAGRYQAILSQDSAAQQKAAETAKTLSYNLGFLERNFGLTQAQALQVAKKLGLLATLGSKIFTSTDKAAIAQFVQTMKLAQNPTTALAFDMNQAANATLGLTSQIQGLTNAFNVLASPFANTIQSTVTWKNDNLTLAQAVRKASGQVGYQTAAQRAAAAALATSITNTIDLSEKTLQSTHSYTKAAGVIQQEINVLEALHSKSALVRRALQILQAQLDALHSKTITLTVNTVGGVTSIFGGGLPGGTVGGLNQGAVTRTGSRGPNVTVAGAGPAVIENHIYIDGREVFKGVQKHAVRRQKRTGNNGLQRITR